MRVPRIELIPGYHSSCLIRGGWQSIGAAPETASDLLAFVDAGVATFETADTYPGGEEYLGSFLAFARRRLSSAQFSDIRIHARFTVPLSGYDSGSIARSVERSLRRLGVERLDLLQLQCWNLQAPGLEEAAGAMSAMQRKGKVRLLGVCNMGVEPLQRVLGTGAPIATNQVPYSLADRRAEGPVAEFCAGKGIALLTYGPLAGGFLTRSWLGEDPPGVAGRRVGEEYLELIRAGIGWQGLQRLLRELAEIGARRKKSTAQVAFRWVLQCGPGKAVLFGASGTRRLADLLPALDFELSGEECASLSAAADTARPPGDVGVLERLPDSRLCRCIRGRLASLPVREEV